MISKHYLKFSIILCLGTGLLFSLFSIVFYFGKWDRTLIVFLLGIFVGALSIPELEPKAIKSPIAFQTIVGAIAGVLVIYAFKANPEYLIYSTIIGAFIGLTASFWLKYFTVP